MDFGLSSATFGRIMIRILTGVVFSLAVTVNAAAAVVEVDPQATYLRMSPLDASISAKVRAVPSSVSSLGPVDLQALGFAPGDAVMLRQLGGFLYEHGWNGSTREAHGMVGVFSATQELLPASAAHRVPGAISVGEPALTRDSYYPSLATDILEDFRIPGAGVSLTIPEGAAYLFVTADDTFFWDNAPGAGGFRLMLERMTIPVPDGGSLLPLVALAVLGLGVVRRRG
jgi:hypothetical protein